MTTTTATPQTRLEKRVFNLATKGIREVTNTDIYYICKHSVSSHGENPTDSQIIEEIASWYFPTI